MSTWFGRSFGALAPVLALTLTVVGCDGGGDDGPTFPENTIEFNGVQVASDSPQEVWYAADQRWIDLYATDGSSIGFAFEGQGDPAVYELPMGHFTGASANLVHVTVCVSSCRTYYTPDDVSGDVYVGGDEGAGILDIAGGLLLDNGTTIDEVIFSYSGDYVYLED